MLFIYTGSSVRDNYIIRELQRHNLEVKRVLKHNLSIDVYNSIYAVEYIRIGNRSNITFEWNLIETVCSKSSWRIIPIKLAVIVVLPSNLLLGNVSPQWCSVNNGVFICFNCSGIHRTFGMQISFVKSVTMDSWTDQQLKMMKEGGNGNFKAFMETYNLNQESPAIKYKTKAAEYYRKSVSLQLIL